MKKMIGTLALGMAIAGSLSATSTTTVETAESTAVTAGGDCVDSTLDFMEEMDQLGFEDEEITAVSNAYYAICTGWM